jgi:hypothetical protein
MNLRTIKTGTKRQWQPYYQEDKIRTTIISSDSRDHCHKEAHRNQCLQVTCYAVENRQTCIWNTIVYNSCLLMTAIEFAKQFQGCTDDWHQLFDNVLWSDEVVCYVTSEGSLIFTTLITGQPTYGPCRNGSGWSAWNSVMRCHRDRICWTLLLRATLYLYESEGYMASNLWVGKHCYTSFTAGCGTLSFYRCCPHMAARLFPKTIDWQTCCSRMVSAQPRSDALCLFLWGWAKKEDYRRSWQNLE